MFEGISSRRRGQARNTESFKWSELFRFTLETTYCSSYPNCLSIWTINVLIEQATNGKVLEPFGLFERLDTPEQRSVGMQFEWKARLAPSSWHIMAYFGYTIRVVNLNIGLRSFEEHLWWIKSIKQTELNEAIAFGGIETWIKIFKEVRRFEWHNSVNSQKIWLMRSGTDTCAITLDPTEGRIIEGWL